MTFNHLSPKQAQIFRWCYESGYNALICDGAVRSGKTICMIVSFVLWAMRGFDGATFGICGKTVASAERNIIMPLQGIADITSYFKLTYTRSSHLLTVEGNGRRNSFFVFGGKDESSYMLIQGVTLSGVLFDEVALMPRSFVEQAIARTLSVSAAKLWFNCNPDNQFHWFYTEWVKQADKRSALRLHFLMSDNPTLSTEQLDNADRMYTGVFHDRYIKGLWVSAEGVIYKQFADNTADYLLDDAPSDIAFATLGMDFGGNGSAHAIVCTGFSRRLQRVVILDEYYRKEIITPTQLEGDVCDFIRRCQSRYRIVDMYCDSAEQVLIRGINAAVRREHIPIDIHNARKSEILGRIRLTSSLVAQNRFFVVKSCKHIIKALQAAVWDSKKLSDVRLDNGEYNIDSIDAYEYSIEPYMRELQEVSILHDI